jgi:hypothetical protein
MHLPPSQNSTLIALNRSSQINLIIFIDNREDFSRRHRLPITTRYPTDLRIDNTLSALALGDFVLSTVCFLSAGSSYLRASHDDDGVIVAYCREGLATYHQGFAGRILTLSLLIRLKEHE